MSTISEKIQYFRNVKGWTLTELADKSGVSRSFLGELEKGISVPTVIVLKKIADAFNVPVDMFFEDNFLSSVELENHLSDDIMCLLRDRNGLEYVRVAAKAKEYGISLVLLEQIILAIKKAKDIESES
jgi:transcriptional regulator with XRE-family HTH domain